MIGAGVAGLTTAVCLAESGLTVTVQARQLPQHTTSAVAGAIWGRHLVEDTSRVTRWCAETLEVLHRSWHIEGQSVRPDHRMVAHTGFLTHARLVTG